MNESNGKESANGEVPAGPAPQDAGAELAALREQLAQKDGELGQAKARALELEQALAAQNGEVAGLRQSKGELEDRLTATGRTLAEAVASYRGTVLQAHPELQAVEELIAGDRVASVNESLGKAKALVARIRQGLESEVALARVPAGAPERTAPDLSGLSAREKIQYAIGGK